MGTPDVKREANRRHGDAAASNTVLVHVQTKQVRQQIPGPGWREKPGCLARHPTSAAGVFLTQSDLLSGGLPRVTVELPSLAPDSAPQCSGQSATVCMAQC